MNENLAQILIHSAQEFPERDAIILQQNDGDHPIQFGELIQGAARYTLAYQQAGIKPDEPIVLILQHGRDLIESFLGALLHGSIPAIMPFLTEKLSPARYREALQALIAISKPGALVTYPAFFEEAEAVLDAGSSVRSILLSSEIPEQAHLDTAELAGLTRAPEDLVLLQHSSGTTGLQKGVALSNRSILNQIDACSAAIGMTSEDVVVSWLPLYHDMGLIAGFIMPIILRSKLVLMSPFDWVRAPHRLLRAVSDYQGTISWLPNFAFNFCSQKIRERDIEGISLASWRAVINCSEPIRHDSFERFQQRFKEYGLEKQALATSYGMAENVFAISQGGIDAPLLVDCVDREQLMIAGRAVPCSEGKKLLRMVSAGKPIDNTRVRIVDKQGKSVGDRVIGEIAIQGDCLLSGYYHREDLTEKSFLDGWFLTGDLAYFAFGELFVTGRRKEIIIVGGKNVYPQDLEYLVADVPGVHPGRVVAFGVFNEELGTEEIVLVAEVDHDDLQERLQIAREIRAVIAQGSDVAVRYVETVDHGWLIKTSSGKIARGANRDKYLQEIAGRSGSNE